MVGGVGGSWSKAGADTSWPALVLPPDLVPYLAHQTRGLLWAVLPGSGNAAQEGQEMAVGSRKGCGLLFFDPTFTTSCRL